MQIWKSTYIFVITWKYYAECFLLLQHLVFELCAPEIYETLFYKHTETIEYVKKQPTFYEEYKFHR